MTPSARAVDASVAVKWLVPAEILKKEAESLLRDSLLAGQPLVGPPHRSGEVANALYRRVRSQDPDRHLTVEEAKQALQTYLELPVTRLSPAGLYDQAFALAHAHQLPSLYDVLYVVLAQLGGIELWIADERLLNALGNAAPWVHGLSTYIQPR